MNAYDREISARLGKALLLEILDVARSGKDAHSRLGISRETLDDLTRLNIAELYGVSASPFLHLKVDDRILNLAVQGALKNRNRDELLNKAIRFGASRAIMQEFARLSYNEFRRRRSDLGIDTNRSRPQQLTNDEYERLANITRLPNPSITSIAWSISLNTATSTSTASIPTTTPITANCSR